MAKQASINLLRSRENHFWEHFLKWALTTGRFLIILTETIALAAFVYRFSLDREIIDLSDKIKQNQTIISFYQPQEILYRNLEERLVFAEQLTTPIDAKAALLEEFVSLARGKVTFQKVTISGSNISVEVATTSPGGLAAFLQSVKTMKEVKSVSVDQVEKKATSGTLLVTITAVLTETAKKGAHAGN